MKESLKKFGKSVSLILALFFSSGLEPWSVKINRVAENSERDDIDFLFDMAQLYEESMEPLRDPL